MLPDFIVQHEVQDEPGRMHSILSRSLSGYCLKSLDMAVFIAKR